MYEEIAMNAFPALLSEIYDGWILRYSDGYIYRGNSVNPIYKSTLNLEEKVIECEKRYFSKALPCVYKMTNGVEHGLQELLEARGYEAQKETHIMEMQLGNLVNEDTDYMECLFHIEERWLDQFVKLNGTVKVPERSISKDMLRSIGRPLICAAIYEKNEMVACGLGVLERHRIGLYDIRVLEKYRKRGYGTRICKKIMSEGIKMGATTAYLQVMSDNMGAIRLYEKIGYKAIYNYWYMVLSDD